ncbi:MAG: anti-sigma factor [Acidimicrobiia bacterium]|nr:anti-sigma factor [Acidimicrobiia bacterium]MDH4306415.1 anti-sigma factor [Acidimicrobiia bacterium]MDH5295037.1 anti-sigma factor [Acidimicrobiia bacterium]
MSDEMYVEEVLTTMAEEDRTFSQPPPELWARIAAEARVEGSQRRSMRWLYAAAAAAIVVVVTGTALWNPGRSVVVAAARLTGGDLPAAESGVVAQASFTENGNLELEFVDGSLPEGDGYYEVWLIKPDLSEMYSLGVSSGDGVYRVPDGVDPEEFAVVDISREPLDGEPAHSGISVLRGVLET